MSCDGGEGFMEVYSPVGKRPRCSLRKQGRRVVSGPLAAA